MKIVALTHYYIEENRAGGEMMLHRILKELAKVHDVTVLITRTIRHKTEIDGVKVVYAATKHTLETYDYDMVITQFENAAFAIQSAHNREKPVFYIAHNDMHQTMQFLRLLNENDIALYNTEWLKDKMTTAARTIVIHPPIDREEFATTLGDHITLVNLIKEKGAPLFYNLAEALPYMKFLAVGGGYYKERQQLTDLPNVTHIENTPNMKDDVYAKTKILLMPSSYESYGMVAAEAICSGIPIICTPTEGLRENLGVAGTYVQYNDLQGYINAIQALQDKKTYKLASQLATARASQKDSQKEIKAFMDLIK